MPSILVNHLFGIFIFTTITSASSNISNHGRIRADSNVKTHSVIDDTAWTKHELHSSKWSSNPSLPVLRQLVSRCEFLNLDWNNITLGQMRMLYRHELESLFSTKRQYSMHAYSKQGIMESTQSKVDCFILFIFSTKCRFSLAAFPYINALARAYPQIKVIGLPVEEYSKLKWSLRILFVPKIKIIVNGRIYREYTGSDVDLYQMIDFVWLNLNQRPRGPVNISRSDFKVDWPIDKSTNIWLILSWFTTIICLIYLYFITFPRTFVHVSNFFHRLITNHFVSSNSESQITVCRTQERTANL